VGRLPHPPPFDFVLTFISLFSLTTATILPGPLTPVARVRSHQPPRHDQLHSCRCRYRIGPQGTDSDYQDRRPHHEGRGREGYQVSSQQDQDFHQDFHQGWNQGCNQGYPGGPRRRVPQLQNQLLVKYRRRGHGPVKLGPQRRRPNVPSSFRTGADPFFRECYKSKTRTYFKETLQVPGSHRHHYSRPFVIRDADFNRTLSSCSTGARQEAEVLYTATAFLGLQLNRSNDSLESHPKIDKVAREHVEENWTYTFGIHKYFLARLDIIEGLQGDSQAQALAEIQEARVRPLLGRGSISADDYRFASFEMDRWVHEGFAEEISEAEARTIGLVVSGFVVHGAKRRVVVDYTTQNEVLGARKFRMDTLADLAPQLRPGNALLKADVQDAYNHLRQRRCDRDKLLFRIAGHWFRPLALNCSLSPARWWFTKFLRPVVQELRRQGHRVISYLDDLSGAPRIDHGDTPATRPMPHGRAGKFESCLGNWG
jgi:hypothetical protein